MSDAANLADLRRLGVSEVLALRFRGQQRKPHNLHGLARTLETLLGFADKHTGEHAFPSFSEVGRITGTSYRTVQRHVLQLEELGVLRKLKSYVSSLRLPYEWSLARGFALQLLRHHLETAKGWIRLRIVNSLRFLERAAAGEATSVAWRRRHPVQAPPTSGSAPVPESAVEAASRRALGGIGQFAQLPPALRAGERNSGGPSACGAGPSPISSRSSSTPAGVSPVPSLLGILEAIRGRTSLA